MNALSSRVALGTTGLSRVIAYRREREKPAWPSAVRRPKRSAPTSQTAPQVAVPRREFTHAHEGYGVHATIRRVPGSHSPLRGRKAYVLPPSDLFRGPTAGRLRATTSPLGTDTDLKRIAPPPPVKDPGVGSHTYTAHALRDRFSLNCGCHCLAAIAG